MVVVPGEEQIHHNVAQRFFELTLGRLSFSDITGYRIFNAFLALSTFGNIIVMVCNSNLKKTFYTTERLTSLDRPTQLPVSSKRSRKRAFYPTRNYSPGIAT
jgi:hypothetical protein